MILAVATIESALASMQAQSVRDIVISVVNDGSMDATREIVERLAAADPRIRVLNQANGGIVDALKAGLALCTTEFVARHDADDLALPNRFEKQFAYLQAHPDCVAVSGAVRHINNDCRLIKAKATLPSPDLSDPGHFPQIEPYLIHPFLMVRRAAIEEDCVFICSALERSGPSIRRSNRALCGRMTSGTAAKLIQHGRTSSAIQLLPPALYPAMKVRLLLRVAMPKMARRMIQKAAGRDSTFTK